MVGSQRVLELDFIQINYKKLSNYQISVWAVVSAVGFGVGQVASET